jgi:hypothetical protein
MHDGIAVPLVDRSVLEQLPRKDAVMEDAERGEEGRRDERGDELDP